MFFLDQILKQIKILNDHDVPILVESLSSSHTYLSLALLQVYKPHFQIQKTIMPSTPARDSRFFPTSAVERNMLIVHMYQP